MDVDMKFSLLVLVLLTGSAWAKWSVSTFNIRNFDRDQREGRTNIPELTKIIREIQSDVMAFEEVVNEAAFKALVKSALPGYSFEISSCGGMGQQHLAIAYNPQIFSLVSSSEDLSLSGSGNSCGSLRPLFLVKLKNKTDNKEYTFGAAHLKAGGDQKAFSQRWSQYEKLKNLSLKNAAQNMILLGDFNSTGYNIKNEDYEHFEEFISGANLRTVSETLGCTNFWNPDPGQDAYQSSILDHIVLQDRLFSQVQETRTASHCVKTECRPSTKRELGVTYAEVSDHCPVRVSFK
jgi:endonuclease/exonuclease/phosphatase family metal-dependent hydrolase